MNSPIELHALAGDEEANVFVGADHCGIAVSMFLVHSPPGAGPKLHMHPNPEVFVIQSGQATFEVAGAELVGEAGQIIVAPPTRRTASRTRAPTHSR
ncbi:MAG: cupin domain-containing protein [Actinomycetota bacterium]|nr:cupin domain-containing protein [Actinomycetota bacterium]